MSQSLAQLYVHLIFSTIGREPFLTDRDRDGLHAYMAGILKNWESPALQIGSVQDHVHVLFRLSKNHALCRVIEEVKKDSSKWLKTVEGVAPIFHWQNGYGAFSVSQSALEETKQYILNQKEHHRKRNFQEEYLEFLKKYQIPYDERYVWD